MAEAIAAHIHSVTVDELGQVSKVLGVAMGESLFERVEFECEQVLEGWDIQTDTGKLVSDASARIPEKVASFTSIRSIGHMPFKGGASWTKDSVSRKTE